MNKFRSCYHKCVKALFCVPKYSNVTTMLLDTGLPYQVPLLSCTMRVFHYFSQSSVDNIIVMF